METAREISPPPDTADKASALPVQFHRGPAETFFAFKLGHDNRFRRGIGYMSFFHIDLHIRLPGKVKPLRFTYNFTSVKKVAV
jgi:hypothetical protein